MIADQRKFSAICTRSGAALLLAAAATVGCASPDARPAPQRVSIAAFANSDRVQNENVKSDAAPASEDRASAADAPMPRQIPLRAVSPAPIEDGAAAPARNRRLQPGDRYIVDSLVGQINGRPIFADAFFAPIEDQLIQLRRRATDREFTAQAHEIISLHLWEQVRDELFLAEAEASLTPEERQGLFAFMRYMREREIAMGGGTRTGAEQRLQDLEGVTLDDYVRGRLDRELVSKLLHEKIMPRVIVTWRDVQREYQRRHREFNPPPVLHLARIRLSNDETEKIEQVNAALEEGRPFAAIAETLGQGDGAWQTFTVGEGGLEDIQVADVLRPHLKGLDIGETTPPIRIGGSTMWLHLARLEQPEGRSLYDLEVQRALMREIQGRRIREEERRYIGSLFRGGVTEELETINLRLLEIALKRYGQL